MYHTHTHTHGASETDAHCGVVIFHLYCAKQVVNCLAAMVMAITTDGHHRTVCLAMVPSTTPL